MASCEASSTNMDESMLVLTEEHAQLSPVLLSMGIEVGNDRYSQRLKNALDNFNAYYLYAMDFLTQILPLAKQQFGKEDTILLPKTPRKKRPGRRLPGKAQLTDITEQNSHPESDLNIIPLDTSNVENQNAPVKRTTRGSKYTSKKSKTEQTSETLPKDEQEIKETRVSSDDKENTEPMVTSEVSQQVEEVPFKRTTRSSKNKTSLSQPGPKKQRGHKQKISEESAADETKDVGEQNNVDGTINSEKSEISLEKSSSRTTSNGSVKRVSFDDKPAAAENNLKRSSSSSLMKPDAKRTKSGDGLESSEPPVVSPERHQKRKSDPMSGATKKVKRDSGGEVTGSRGEKETHVPNADTSMEVDVEVSVGTPKQVVSETFVTESPMEVTSSEKTNASAGKKTEFVTESPAVTPSVESNTNPASIIVVTETPDSQKSPEEAFASPAGDNVVGPSPIVMVLSTSEYATPPQEKPETADEGIAVSLIYEDQTQQKNETVVIASNKKPFVRRSKRSSMRRVVSGSHNVRRSSRRVSCRLSKRSGVFKKPHPVSSSSESEGTSSSEQTKDAVDAVSPIKRPLSTTGFGDDEQDGPTTSTPDVHPTSSDSGDDEVKPENNDGPSTSTPDMKKPRRSLRLSTKLSLKDEEKTLNSPLTENNSTPNVGKVAGIVKEINNKNISKFVEKHASICVNKTPGTDKKTRNFSTYMVKRSSTRPSNIVGGNVRSFISRPSSKRIDPNEVARLKKLELLRKQEKEKETLDHAEQRRKIWTEEQKRKREEKQKRVNEAKAAREKEEQEKKERQLEEKKHLLQALEQAKKRKEQEEENKKKLREQRKKEADARRLKENEERIKRLQEKEEEERLHREILKRKQEQEEHERKQRILEDKRLQEQKQRERQREHAEGRERRLREIKEKEAEKMREEAEKKEKERKQKEAEDREKKRIALLIKEKMAQERKEWEEKRARDEKERRQREDLAKQKTPVGPSCKSVLQIQSADSYMMTPPPGQTRKPSIGDNYNIEELRSDESTDDEDCPRKKVPTWAQGISLKNALLHQDGPRKIFAEISRCILFEAPKLEEIFVKKRRRFYQRTSSAHWDTPPMKKICT